MTAEEAKLKSDMANGPQRKYYSIERIKRQIEADATEGKYVTNIPIENFDPLFKNYFINLAYIITIPSIYVSISWD